MSQNDSTVCSYIYRPNTPYQMDQYRYKRLNHDRPNLRLLRLHQGSRGELMCNLFEAFLDHDDLIRYEALSYTWGAPATPRSITVDEQRLAITENLYQALISLRPSHADRVLWIDAICIDQSNKKERSHQVAQMSDIYKQAECVIFFLGRATFNTDAFMDYMSLFQQERSKYAYRSWAQDDKRWKIIQEAVQGKMEKLDIDTLSLGLKSLLNRSWFLRVWILQEVANAKSAVVCCGKKEVAASVFSIAPIIFNVSPSVHCQSVIDIMPGPWRKTSWWSKGPCLYTLLSKFDGAQATESRDLIYALRGIATDKECPILAPDYDKSEECLVRDVVRFLFDFEYDAKMAWSMLGTVRDVIRSLKQIKDRIFMERIKTGEVSCLDSLLQAPGFTFSPTVVGAALQFDKTGQMLETLMKHAEGYKVSTETLLAAVEKGSVSVVQVLEKHLGNEVAATTKEMLLAAAKNHLHGHDMVSYILGGIHDSDDYCLVAEVAASNSTQAARIIQQLLGRGSQIMMTLQLQRNALKSGCYDELFLLFINCPRVGLRMRDETANVDGNKSTDGAAENVRLVFRSIARFLISYGYATYEYTLFDVFRQTCRQIERHGYNILEELTLCAVEIFKEEDRSLSTWHEKFKNITGILGWFAKQNGFDFNLTIGVVKASIEGNFTGSLSNLLAQKRDSIDIDSDAAAEIIRAYRLAENDDSDTHNDNWMSESDILRDCHAHNDILMTEFILRYRDGQFRQTQIISEALTARYCDSESRSLEYWLDNVSYTKCHETFRWLWSCGSKSGEKVSNKHELLRNAGDSRIAALLLSNGADPNWRRDESQLSILCCAVAARSHILSELLLVCGANPCMFDGYKGNTPLIRAVRADDIWMVKLLLQYGADSAVRNKKGKRPEDVAKSDAIISLLQKHSSRFPVKISPSVQQLMKDHGLVPKPHERLIGTRLLWDTHDIGCGVHNLRKRRKFKDISE